MYGCDLVLFPLRCGSLIDGSLDQSKLIQHCTYRSRVLNWELSSAHGCFLPALAEVWTQAASAAVSILDGGANATTILMPSGVGDLQVGLRVVREFIATAPQESQFRVVVAIPSSLAGTAERLYLEELSGRDFTVTSLAGPRVSKHTVAMTLRQNNSMILLCPYEGMMKLGLGFIQSQIKMPLDLAVFATAHVLRAGGFHGLGAREDVLPARRRNSNLKTKTTGYGSKLNHQGTAGFSHCFLLPGCHFGYLFLTQLANCIDVPCGLFKVNP